MNINACPFCKFAGSYVVTRGSFAWVECSNQDCMAEGPHVELNQMLPKPAAEAAAVEAWNERAPCEWVEIEEGTEVYNTCRAGEEFHLTEGMELWPHCHWCGRKIVAIPCAAAEPRGDQS